MRKRLLVLGGGLLLAACSTGPDRPDGGALRAIGTPVYAAFKAVGCVGTAALAAPGAALLAMTDRPDKEALTRELERGLAHNCGDRWTLAGS